MDPASVSVYNAPADGVCDLNSAMCGTRISAIRRASRRAST